MAKPYIISGIDIGNSQVKVVIASINPASLRPEIIGVASATSHGLRKGMVVDMEETINDIATALQRAEAMAGVKVRRAYLAVNGLHIRTQISKGVIAVSRADNEISQNDIDRVLNAASVVSLPPNREIIHVIPRNYVLDGSEYVKNPLGMKAVRLEAEVFIIDGLSPYFRNIAKCVNENGIEVGGLVYAPLAASLSVLDKNQKENGVMHIDFGGGTSSLTIFEEADLIHSAILPVGSKHITNDLAVALRTSMDVAERVKIEHCTTSELEDLRKKEMIDLSKLTSEEGYLIPKKQLVKVVDARLHELLDLVNVELKKVSRSLLPAGVVLSGGGANLPGFVTLVKEQLRLPVRLAQPFHESLNLDASLAVATGLVVWGMEQELSGSSRSSSNLFDQTSGFGRALKGLLKNFLP